MLFTSTFTAQNLAQKKDDEKYGGNGEHVLACWGKSIPLAAAFPEETILAL